jgi:hypothetical protein
MKLPDVYRDWRVLLGLSLVVLGAGNWTVGRIRTKQYSQLISSQSTNPGESSASSDQAYRSFDELDAGATAVLAPLTAEQRRVSYATARMDFYHATFLAGCVLVLLGLLLTFFGFLSLIRNDARRAAARIRQQSIRVAADEEGEIVPPRS